MRSAGTEGIILAFGHIVVAELYQLACAEEVEPELLGLSSSQYQQAAASLVTPALGFLFLYALGLPLKKIPFIDAIEGYSPAAWLLPLFALGAAFILSNFPKYTDPGHTA